MNYFNEDSSEVVKELNTDVERGLTDVQVKESRQKYGYNLIEEEKPKSIFRVFLEQFTDLLVIILIIASIFSAFTGNLESTIVILAVITMNAILGTAQHVKAQKSLMSLKAMSAPRARVKRNGEFIEIPASEVVVGDILFVEAGNVIPADGRLIETAYLQVNESALTGESLNVLKDAEKIDKTDLPLGDRLNMVYSGSSVANGHGTIVVTAVGMQTEIGKVASLIQNAKRKKTPLQNALDKFSKVLSFVIIGICAVVFLLTKFVNGQEITDALMFAIALAVAAIPEALSSIITISLAIGTQKMSKQKAIIKDLKAVESLGCVSIICSDKTGTLTQNKMTVREIYSICDGAKEDLKKAMSLCNDAERSGDAWLGDPTEIALLDYVAEELSTIRLNYPRVDEIPFDSDRKLMSTVHVIDGERVMFTKGALDVILPRTTFIEDKDGARAITEQDKEQILLAVSNLSSKGMRVLAFAKKILESDKNITVEDEREFIFVGLAAMTDPPRVESKQAIEDCISAGIKPIMITGDHKDTARAIAEEIGIFKEGDICIDGPELDKTTDEQLMEILEKISVYARVSPVHKIRIVELWQKKGKVVAMTGDGVNDAPALKKADVGVAMGITGTEVSKDAASMILADDNFATIVKSVSNGRSIYSNIKNTIKFLLAGNTAAILVVLITTFLNLPLPFTPVHLLFINLLTDSLPALALCMEPAQLDVMREKPRASNEAILNKETTVYILVHSLMIATCVMLAFMMGNQISGAMASTMAFATLCLARLFEGFDSRSKYSLFKIKVRTNWYSLGAFAVGALLLMAVLLISSLHGVMDIATSFNYTNLLMVVIFAIIPFVITQLVRVIIEIVKKCCEKKVKKA
ncbi:MAG: cation-translocating P-type ATPase [Clostridia bacterium]|nr:cation-translocating P-type ATPase [Clostridia bacterium]